MGTSRIHKAISEDYIPFLQMQPYRMEDIVAGKLFFHPAHMVDYG
jgi:hypothetical protein